MVVNGPIPVLNESQKMKFSYRGIKLWKINIPSCHGIHCLL